jgi:hypothetical protein
MFSLIHTELTTKIKTTSFQCLEKHIPQETGLVQSLANWGAVAAVRQNAGFADHH